MGEVRLMIKGLNPCCFGNALKHILANTTFVSKNVLILVGLEELLDLILKVCSTLLLCHNPCYFGRALRFYLAGIRCFVVIVLILVILEYHSEPYWILHDRDNVRVLILVILEDHSDL